MPPRVTISVGSRFHAFDLARELERQGILERLYTGYPRYSYKRFGLPRERMRSFPWYEVMNRVYFSGLGRRVLPRGFAHVYVDWFDRRVARALQPGASVFIGFSGGCLHSLRRARKLGMTTVVERGSADIRWQHAILFEEAQRTGATTELPSAASIQRDVEEYGEVDYISVPSEFAARTFIHQGVPERRLLINPYGVDLSHFTPAPNGGSAADGPLRVIHVGRVSVQKGVHYLVEAVGMCPGAHLTLVGAIDPGMERFIRRPFVTAVGAVPGSELPRYYAQANVFALLSLQEGLALVIAQAMAMGLPVVATPNSGAETILTHDREGLIVPARSSTDAARAFAKLADPALRRRLGAAARARVAAGFSWRDYGERAAAIYTRIAERGTRCGAES